MKKKKSLHGFLANKKNPISMEEIVSEIKKDRKESDKKREVALEAVTHGKHQYFKKRTILSFNEYVKSLGI